MSPESLSLRFRLGSIPVVVEPWFWLMTFGLGSNLRGPMLVMWVAVVFVSILVHEMGHALASRHFGARAWVKLHAMGGLTFPDRALPRMQNIAMTFAGPAAGFALAALAYALSVSVPAVADSFNGSALLKMLIDVNVWWGILNLAPVPPLDGGHIALALGGARYERTVHTIAVGIAGLVTVWSLATGDPFRAVMFGLLAWHNVQRLQRM